MKYDGRTILYVVKEILKLPLEKKRRTVKMDDIDLLMKTLLESAPKKEIEAWIKNNQKGV